jgi:hypothetical protein
MNILLVRVGADQSDAGGSWNAPVNSKTREFVYASIPEYGNIYPNLEKPFYDHLRNPLESFNVDLPSPLRDKNMHLDPDFSKLTYGDHKQRGEQIRKYLKPDEDDKIVFYAGLKDIHPADRLVYAIIGILTIKDIVNAKDIARVDRDINAHTRRENNENEKDIVVFGKPKKSGRLKLCIPFGEYRNGAYRIKSDLLKEWGPLWNLVGDTPVKDGYIQRAARLPKIKEPEKFWAWFEGFEDKEPELIQDNNIYKQTKEHKSETE